MVDAVKSALEAAKSVLPNTSVSQEWHYSQLPDLSGKVYIITGGSAGIGYGIVRGLLSKNASKIIFLSANDVNGRISLATAQDELTPTDRDRVEWVQCDFADLKDTDRVSCELRDRFKDGRLDGFCANAGIGIGPYSLSKDGIENHFQINHLAQMHMILTLLPVLAKTAREHAQTRLVFQSSENHRLATSSHKFETLEEINTDIGAAPLYNRTKLAQILFMRCLVRRLEEEKLPTANCPATGRSGIIVNAVHPGAVYTNQMKQMDQAWGLPGTMLRNVFKPLTKDPLEEGCLPALYALADPEIAKKGIYCSYITPPNRVSEMSSVAQDDEKGKQLWRLSEELLHQKLGKAGSINNTFELSK